MSEPHRKAPRWAWWVATGLGSGLLRPAPGTWGSLAGLGAWCLFSFTVTGQDLLSPIRRAAMEGCFILVIGLMAWLSVRASDLVVEETGADDPGFIVADEWVGMWVTLWPLRWEAHRVAGPGGWRWALLLVLPFLVFRVLDIWKPWPVYQLQDLPGGQGIVADDLVAGLYGLPLVALVTPFLIPWLSQ
jgi:phosphatidylglycerophosphatase A